MLEGPAWSHLARPAPDRRSGARPPPYRHGPQSRGRTGRPSSLSRDSSLGAGEVVVALDEYAVDPLRQVAFHVVHGQHDGYERALGERVSVWLWLPHVRVASPGLHVVPAGSLLYGMGRRGEVPRGGSDCARVVFATSAARSASKSSPQVAPRL